MDSSRNINDVQGLLACCGSLVYLDEERVTLHFIHSSVKQFLLEDPLDDRPKSGSDLRAPSSHQFTLEEANLEIGGIIVTYLHYDELDTQILRKLPRVPASHAPMGIIRSSLHNSKITRAIAMKLLKGSRGDINVDVGDVLVAGSGYYDKFTVQQFHFHCYAREYWLDHTKTIQKAAPCIFTLFQKLVSRPNLLEGAHLWQDSIHSYPKVEERGILWALDNSHSAFVTVDLKLNPHNARLLAGSLISLCGAKPQMSIENDLYIELLQAISGERLPGFITASVARPKEYLGSLLIDSAVLRSLKKTLSSQAIFYPYEFEFDRLRDYLHSLGLSPSSSRTTTRCVLLLSMFSIDPVVRRKFYRDIFGAIVDFQKIVNNHTIVHDLTDKLLTGINLPNDFVFLLGMPEKPVLPQTIQIGLFPGIVPKDTPSKPTPEDIFSDLATTHILHSMDNIDGLYDSTIETLIQFDNDHWRALERLINAARHRRHWLSAHNCTDLCVLVLRSRPWRTDWLLCILERITVPKLIDYQGLISGAMTAVCVEDIDARSKAVSIILFHSALQTSASGPYCSLSFSDPEHKIIRVGSSYLCECHVPKKYNHILSSMWVREDTQPGSIVSE